MPDQDFFFFNDTATTEIYTLSLHDALPIYLQNDPADIPALVAALGDGGASAVAGYRVERRDTAWKRLQSRIANGVRNLLDGESIRDTGGPLQAVRAHALPGLALFNSMHRFPHTL